MRAYQEPGISSHSRSLGIDLLRIISCAIVVLSHYGLISFFNGTQGVVIFFIISGYCMAYSTSGRTALQFLSARMWRLVPPLLICATITFVFKLYFLDAQSDRFVSLKDYLGNLVCLPNGNLLCDAAFDIFKGRAGSYRWVDGVYWSLLVEIRFYFLLAVLFYVLKIRRFSILAILGLLAPFNFSTNLISKSEDFLLYLCFFSFGLAYSSFTRGEKGSLSIVLLSLFVYAMNCYFESYGLSMSLTSESFLTYLLCFGIFILGMTLKKAHSNEWITYLGLLTYPIYLLHQDIGLTLIDKMKESVGDIPSKLLATAAVLVLAASANYVVEFFQPRLRNLIKRT